MTLEEFMRNPLTPFRRAGAVGLMLAVSFAPQALAQQHRACAVVQAELTALNEEQSRFSSSKLLRAIQRQNREIRRAERDYRTEGCNQAHVEAYLRPICDGISDVLEDMYDNLDTLKEQAADAKWMRKEKRQLTRKANRLGCDINSSVTIAANRRTLPNPFTNRLDDLAPQTPRVPEVPNYTHLSPYQTVRTMCVRKSDGYYWPISFSTTRQYLDQDAAMCVAQCPQAEVSLYFHKTIGENVKNMVSLKGEKYQDLDTAFLYRTKRDATQCKPESQNLITEQFAEKQWDDFVPPQTKQAENLGLPPLDPRWAAPKVADADAAVGTTEIKTINSAGQTVRLVGPDNPYVRLAEESS